MNYVVRVKDDKGGPDHELHVSAPTERDAMNDVAGRGWVPVGISSAPTPVMPAQIETRYKAILVLSSVLIASGIVSYVAAIGFVVAAIISRSVAPLPSVIPTAVYGLFLHAGGQALRALRDIAINSFNR